MKTRIAFYLGRRAENRKSMIGDWLICLVTRSRFSHVELIESHRQAPWGTVVNHKPYTGPLAKMWSSSLRDKGVRGKTMTLVPERWEVVEIDGDSRGAIAYIKKREGTPYGWPDLVGFLLPVSLNTVWEFCSEIAARGLIFCGFTGLGKPQKTAPEHLSQWAKKQPGYRIVQADELLKEWRHDAA
jgi:hypothetical protein